MPNKFIPQRGQKKKPTMNRLYKYTPQTAQTNLHYKQARQINSLNRPNKYTL